MKTLAPLNEQTILIVDDTPRNLEVIGKFLEEAGFEIAAAQDGESGIEIAQRIHPDLILLDVLMPGIDGIETCRRLKADELTMNIPVIFLTALTERELKIAGFEAGGVDYITKPVQVDEVLARVRIHVELQAMQRQLARQNEALQQEIIVRQRAEEDLREARTWLEQRVEERTLELAHAVANLKLEVDERTRTGEELRRRNRELTLLNRVIAASAMETSLENILNRVCHASSEAFEAPQTAVALLNEDKTEAVLAAEHRTGSLRSTLGYAFDLKTIPAARQILNDNVALVANNAATDPRLKPIQDYIQRQGIASMLITPLIFQEDMLGFLGIETTEPRRFSVEEVRLAQNVATQVSGVLARLKLDENRRKLEAQYHQAQKMEAIGRLTGGVAHDFNNILTVILGNTDLMLMRLDISSPLRPEVTQIRKAAERAAGLTRQLLAFSRQQILQPQILNLNDIIVNLEKMLRRLVGEDVDFKTILDKRLGPTKADAGQIEQVIMNLVVNARDAMPEGGKLTIETAGVTLDETYTLQHLGVDAGNYVMIAVSDTGTGMDAEVKKHIFEPFFTTKEQGRGTGLGLATVHGIVSQSGGHIWVYSEPGEGTSFKIYLPLIEETVASAEDSKSSSQSERGWETIVVVEDENLVRELTVRILKADGYLVFEAGDGNQARQIFSEQKGTIHLLLTDVVIPGGKKGPELAKELAELHPEIKVLYMSGYTDNAIVHKGVLDNGIAFLSKPFSPEDLIAKVRKVLDGPAM
ncbi:MAG: response regulator [Deltaproteobacteria bacterium]|nr:response regulator [Deltaproteobacteria bacterium]